MRDSRITQLFHLAPSQPNALSQSDALLLAPPSSAFSSLPRAARAPLSRPAAPHRSSTVAATFRSRLLPRRHYFTSPCAEACSCSLQRSPHGVRRHGRAQTPSRTVLASAACHQSKPMSAHALSFHPSRRSHVLRSCRCSSLAAVPQPCRVAALATSSSARRRARASPCMQPHRLQNPRLLIRLLFSMSMFFSCGHRSGAAHARAGSAEVCLSPQRPAVVRRHSERPQKEPRSLEKQGDECFQKTFIVFATTREFRAQACGTTPFSGFAHRSCPLFFVRSSCWLHPSSVIVPSGTIPAASSTAPFASGTPLFPRPSSCRAAATSSIPPRPTS